MPTVLSTGADAVVLNSWGFNPGGAIYQSYKTRLVSVPKGIYQALNLPSASPPSPSQCEAGTIAAMPASAHYVAYVRAAHGHMNPTNWPIFAISLSRFLLDKEWYAISH
jgi:hypothetical protein